MRRIIILLLVIVASGCTNHRGIPVHGGGKRFDEEQRMIAASISEAVSQINWDSLSGKKVAITFHAMDTSGAGAFEPGGINTISLLPSYTSKDEFKTRTDLIGPNDTGKKYKEKKVLDQKAVTADLEYTWNSNYQNKRMDTSEDLIYLQEVMKMYASCREVKIVKNSADVVMNVMIDILGTNRSLKDQFIFSNEKLRSTCELSYYMEDGYTGKLIEPIKQIAGAAEYNLLSLRFSSYSKAVRTINSDVVLNYNRTGSKTK